MVTEEGSSSVTSSSFPYFPFMSLSPGLGSPYPWLKELKSEERGLCLIHLLLACSKHVAAGNLDNANTALEHISFLASPGGDNMQRIASYFSGAFADRLLKGWPGLHKALNSTRIPSFCEEFMVQKLFFELCPFLKLAYLITSQTIMEAMEGEKMVHIIDLCSFEPAQWTNLLQAMSSQPGGPPHLKITGIHERKEVLEQMALQLSEEAETLDIPFQFIPVVSKLEDLDVDSLRVKTGEALAISSVLQMHSLLACEDRMPMRNSLAAPKYMGAVHLQKILNVKEELVDKDLINVTDLTSSSMPSLPTSPKLRAFLSALRGLSPKLMVLTEQESNHNSSFTERVMGALNFYAALFDGLESTMPRESLERRRLEKWLFGEEIKNIIACEGAERTVRHEKLENWIQRLELAGFGRTPLSCHSLLLARRFLLANNYDGYRIREENGCLVICWQDRPLYSVSAWSFRH